MIGYNTNSLGEGIFKRLNCCVSNVMWVDDAAVVRPHWGMSEEFCNLGVTEKLEHWITQNPAFE